MYLCGLGAAAKLLECRSKLLGVGGCVQEPRWERVCYIPDWDGAVLERGAYASVVWWFGPARVVGARECSDATTRYLPRWLVPDLGAWYRKR